MSQELILDRKVEDEKNTARMLYFVHGLTFFFTLGLLSVIPLIINYIKRPDAEGTMVYSHHSWMIRSFWWYVVWMAVGGLLAVTIIGIPVAWLVWVGAWIWKAYRLIVGFIRLNENSAAAV